MSLMYALNCDKACEGCEQMRECRCYYCEILPGVCLSCMYYYAETPTSPITCHREERMG